MCRLASAARKTYVHVHANANVQCGTICSNAALDVGSIYKGGMSLAGRWSTVQPPCRAEHRVLTSVGVVLCRNVHLASVVQGYEGNVCLPKGYKLVFVLVLWTSLAGIWMLQNDEYFDLQARTNFPFSVMTWWRTTADGLQEPVLVGCEDPVYSHVLITSSQPHEGNTQLPELVTR